MPHWATRGMDKADALAVVVFLRTLPPVTNQLPDNPPCAAWEQLNGGCMTDADCNDGAVCTFLYCLPASPDASTSVDAVGTSPDVPPMDAHFARRDGGRAPTDAGPADDAGTLDAPTP